MRTISAGTVSLHLNGPVELVVQGELKDVSLHGFRVRHDNYPIKPGTAVDVSYSWGRVKARIVWTRQLGTQIDSGFLLLE
jgi:hypothetical protein